MSTSDGIEERKRQVLSTSRLITFALIAGLVFFGTIAFVSRWAQQPGDLMVAYLAVGMSVLMIVVQAIFPQVMVANKRSEWLNPPAGQDRIDAARAPLELCMLFHTKRIMQCAMLEGAGFFCLIAYIITGQWWLYAIVFLLIAIMIFTLPTRPKLDQWIENQMQLLELSQ